MRARPARVTCPCVVSFPDLPPLPVFPAVGKSPAPRSPRGFSGGGRRRGGYPSAPGKTQLSQRVGISIMHRAMTARAKADQVPILPGKIGIVFSRPRGPPGHTACTVGIGTGLSPGLIAASFASVGFYNPSGYHLRENKKPAPTSSTWEDHRHRLTTEHWPWSIFTTNSALQLRHQRISR